METFITIINLAAALFMILVVLVQGGTQGGVSATFGGGNTQGVFGATGATSVLSKITYSVAAIFMASSIYLTVLQGGSGQNLSEKLEERAKEQASETVIPK